MLTVTKLSGEEVASISVGEVGDVRSLKRRLSQLPNIPPRFRQRLILNDRGLEDAVELHSPMDLKLVLLPFADVPQAKVNKLSRAALRGSAAKVAAMLQHPQNPDLFDADGSTALVQASLAGHVEVVALLLEAGADRDLAEAKDDGFTPLTAASSENQVEVIRLLLEAGASKDLMDKLEATALMASALQGHVEVVRLLVKAGASKELVNEPGDTALMIASRSGHVEVVRLLLEAGADKDFANSFAQTALTMASRNGDLEVTRLLLAANTHIDLAKRSVGRAAFLEAADRGHVEVVSLLIDAANKASWFTSCVTGLLRAACYGNVEVVRSLLKAGDVTSPNIAKTALTLASRHGHAEIVRLLSEADGSLGTGKRRRLC